MKTVLVTGPIGGGKSTACRYLESLGYPVYDCDSRCKALYASVPGLAGRIEEALGIPMTELSRIFSDDVLRLKLEAIVYPLLAEDLQAWKDSLDAPLAFVESAVALDKPAFDPYYDSVLLVTAGPRTRRARNPKAAERDHLQSFSSPRIDYTVHNNRSRKELYRKIDKYLSTVQ